MMGEKRNRALVFIGIVSAVAAFCRDASAQISFGMSAPLSGPSAELGQQIKSGVELSFGEANRAGGVNGAAIELKALDDGYEPARTISNMKVLLADSRVVGIVGNVGTPTAVAALPLVIDAHIPFYGALTGAGVLRKNPPDRVVFNVRASYAEEIGAMIDVLVNRAHLSPSEIAFFTQRDAYGDAGFAAGLRGLVGNGFESDTLLRQVRYIRNTVAVEDAVADIAESANPPRAIIMVGTYAPSAKFIRLLTELEIRPLFFNVSFVGTEALAHQIADLDVPVIVTQVVPDYNGSAPAASAYRLALGSSGSASYISFEGYIAGRLLTDALRRMPSVGSRADVVAALEHLGNADVGLGAPAKLSVEEHQALHQIWVTVIEHGIIRSIDWDEIQSFLRGPSS